MRKIYTKNNLSNKIKDLNLYNTSDHHIAWGYASKNEEFVLIAKIQSRGSHFIKKFKVKTITKDTVSIKSVFSIFDLIFVCLIPIFAAISILLMVSDEILGGILVITFALLISIIPMLIYRNCWRAITNSIKNLY